MWSCCGPRGTVPSPSRRAMRQPRWPGSQPPMLASGKGGRLTPTELELRNADVIRAEGDLLTASARLCELLDLDPSVRLVATDGWVVPAPLVPEPIPLPELIAIALVQRPELRERQAVIQEALLA